MSSKQYDNNNIIHLGNYEEYFILYLDNELSSDQTKMVDDFLEAHPDLRGELEMLMHVKLPGESFSINKQDLFADSMKSTSINEELLLYIDNELSEDKISILESELASNKEYRLEHQQLLQTKLDALEIISYPNKKELFRNTERRIGFQSWMRVAAAAIIIALGIVYFSKTGTDNIGPDKVVHVKPKNTTEQKPLNKQTITVPAILNNNTPQEKTEIAVNNPVPKIKSDKKNHAQDVDGTLKQILKNQDNKDQIAVSDNNEPASGLNHSKADVISTNVINNGTTSINTSNKDLFNKGGVTSDLAAAFNNRTKETNEPLIANNNTKGKVKGFLRKATRLIEKKTGFNPTNDDGELLIGMVAVKLK